MLMWSIGQLYIVIFIDIFTYLLTVHRPTLYNIGHKSARLRLIKIDHFCDSALNDRLCLAVMFMVTLCIMNCVFIIINKVSRQKMSFRIQICWSHFDKTRQKYISGGAQHLGALWFEFHFLKETSHYEFQYHTPM